MKRTIIAAVFAVLAAHSQAGDYANSVTEFSGVQGQDGWFYGYYLISEGDSPADPSTFRELDEFSTVFSNTWSASGSPSWISVGERSQHPHIPGAGRNRPGTFWATRRWVSDQDATIRITGFLDDADLGGDGTEAFIYLDGTLIQSWVLPATSNSSIGLNISTTVAAGSIIDFVVSPRSSINFDGTRFEIVIRDEDACPADFNCSGSANFFDIADFIAAFQIQDPATDFQPDGQYNFFDVSAYIALFNSGCP